jgi:hypothetical protein
MGEVYRARDGRLDRDVALKVLPQDVREDAERLARFTREAKLLASLNHPSVGAIYGLEEGVGGGPPVLVLELISGQTLEEILTRGPMEVGEALGVAAQIADGLEAAHDLGIVHRDLKPSNVKLTTEGRVKILDFGLAKAVVVDPAFSSGPSPTMTTPTITTGGTQLGAVIGTLTYMSPEQARGKPVDRRTDIWSFGCLLYECLTATRAFGGENASETIGAILHLPPDWTKLPPATPPRVREMLVRCLEKDPRKRLRDIGDARIELEQTTSGVSSSPSVSVPVPATRTGRRGFAALVLAGVAIAGTLTGSAVTRMMTSTAEQGRVARVAIEIPPSITMLGTSFDLSPDGRYLMIAGRPKSAPGAPQEPARLYLRRLDGLDFTAIKGSEDFSQYALSQDSRSIAFTAPTSRSSSERTLFKVALDGGAPPIAIGPWDAAWGGLVWLEGGDFLTAGGGGKSLVRLSGTDSRPSAPVSFRGVDPTLQLFPIRTLPGGRRVLAVTILYDKRGYQIGIASADPVSGETTIVVADGGAAVLAPTGQVVFSRRDAILVAPFDLGRSALTSAPVAVLDGLRTDNSWSQGAFALSSDGTLAYAPGGQVGSKRRLVAALPDGTIEAWSDEERAFEANLSVAADGRRAAVVIPTPQATYEIWIAERGRPGLRRFASVPGADIAGPVWTPDGTAITYYRIGRTDADGIYVARADGGGAPRRILKFADAVRRSYFPEAFTPDGASLVAVAFSDGKADLALVPVAPGTGESEDKIKPLVTGPGNESSPRFSPDGGWLAWSSDESGKTEIYVGAFARDGTVGSPFPVSHGGGNRPAWSADGRTLYFVTPDERVMAAAFDPRTGAAMPPKLHLDLASARLSQPTGTAVVLPDGRLFAIQKGEDEAEVRRIDLVLNWTRELKGK